ncbi:deaminase [Caulobacter sp. CCUG 60055]|uniref:RibD family protein n=1 Tax=Caulobacter sp. CCUG 60055 TaxID=2100090 RepID=UPI001FA750CA|nr:RibD family protein [Caulobacter sp. CCUG 60055]MCI3179026.1 deaminase [Caulobacter sp. CCUG 60055]
MTARGAPRVTLKLATSLDGRIATAAGESRWITGPAAREAVHRLRAGHDAVLIGVETALADDPELTVRLADFNGRQPARVVLDSRQRLPADGRLARSAADVPLFVVATGAPERRLTDVGARVVQVEAAQDGRPDPAAVVGRLAEEGFARLFVEGGGQVAASFLRAGLVDEIEWFRAPMILGGEGRPAVGGMEISALAAAPRFRRIDLRTVGDDLWERYERL